jgi:hypothetical protein
MSTRYGPYLTEKWALANSRGGLRREKLREL